MTLMRGMSLLCKILRKDKRRKYIERGILCSPFTSATLSLLNYHEIQISFAQGSALVTSVVFVREISFALITI